MTKTISVGFVRSVAPLTLMEISRKSVFICEVHRVITDGFRTILSVDENYARVEAFNTPDSLLQRLQDKVPDVLILDMNLPGINGMELLEQIRYENKRIRILLLMMLKDVHLVEKGRKLGVNGFLLKDFEVNELVNAISKIQKGRHYISPGLISEMSRFEEDGTCELTSREKEIVKQCAGGRTSIEIAEKLYLSPHTVNTHRRNIYRKLGLSNIKELIRFAYDEGFA